MVIDRPNISFSKSTKMKHVKIKTDFFLSLLILIFHAGVVVPNTILHLCAATQPLLRVRADGIAAWQSPTTLIELWIKKNHLITIPGKAYMKEQAN